MAKANRHLLADHSALVVGVIASLDDLRTALRMADPPDIFELRLDLLPHLDLSDTQKLGRPFIITARHPTEGGALNLSLKRRRDLLLRFIAQARFIDVESRSIPALEDVWEQARARRLIRICSIHHLRHTPSLRALRAGFRRARGTGADVVKVVTRADTISDWLRLLDLLIFEGRSARLSVMALGGFGPLSRQIFPACGSALVYAPLLRSFVEGQLTLGELRKSLRPTARA